MIDLIDPLRHGLGSYLPRGASLPRLGLTLHDLGELIRRAGLQVGFIVETEYCVATAGDCRWIDWVWLGEDGPVVAFEIEGPGVPAVSITKDETRFKRAGAGINVVALYQVDHDRTPRDPRIKKAEQRVKAMLTGRDARVYLSESLMRPDGIESLQMDALEFEKQRRLATRRGNSQ